MTESIENELTPEEKLLKVIRDGDGEDSSAPEAVAAETAETIEKKKPELKLVEKDEESKSDLETKAPAATIAPDVVDAVADDDNDSAGVVKSKRGSLVSMGFCPYDSICCNDHNFNFHWDIFNKRKTEIYLEPRRSLSFTVLGILCIYHYFCSLPR